MKTIKLFACLALIALIPSACQRTSTPAPLADTPKNRSKMADRYIQVVPMNELMVDLGKNMSATLPEPKRQEFLDLLSKHVDYKAINQIGHDALVRHFTAPELEALAKFYGSPEAKSAMKKFGSFVADVAPAMSSEMQKAVERASKTSN